MITASHNVRLRTIDALLPRVVVLVRLLPGADTRTLQGRIAGLLPSLPLEIREIADEEARLGSDMYVFLARRNFELYLVGGLLLSIIGILAVAVSNYVEEIGRASW